MTTPLRLQSAWRTVTGNLRTLMWAPGYPQAALNSGGTAGRKLGREVPHAAMATAMSARAVIAACSWAVWPGILVNGLTRLAFTWFQRRIDLAGAASPAPSLADLANALLTTTVETSGWPWTINNANAPYGPVGRLVADLHGHAKPSEKRKVGGSTRP
jgi:hypothetical protein